MKKTAIVILSIPSKCILKDVELPMNISADRVIEAIAQVYKVDKISHLICENPIALINGKKTLGELGIHDGSVIKYVEG